MSTFREQGQAIVDAVAYGGAFLAYCAIAESIGGGTLGKLLFRCRVVGGEKELVGLSRTAIRAALAIPESLFVGIPAYMAMTRSPLRQRTGDSLAHTVVVKRTAVSFPTFRIYLGIIAGTVAGIVTAAWFFSGGMVHAG